MITSELKPGLEIPPSRMQTLPISRGYPVPWFVAWVDGEPEFRVADGKKFRQAIREKLCWVCGEPLGKHMVFLLGPMCGINRTTAEPPCHRDCAEYSVKNCPFLSKPQMVRRENDMPEGGTCSGAMIRRNPGVILLWGTAKYTLFNDGRGGVLLNVGNPEWMTWWAQGRSATREEVQHSVETGLPLLMEMAVRQSGAVEDLLKRKAWLESRYPAK